MKPDFVVTAGRVGGDFDALIAYLGRPVSFGYESHNAKHVIMQEGRGTTGDTVELMRSLGGFLDEIKLHDATGALLLDISSQRLAFGMENPKSGADGALDAMMDAFQNGTIAGLPAAYRFVGNAGDDRFTGLAGADTLTGGDGQDRLAGGGGADSVAGGAGDDTLMGGSGADTLRGNAGADVFVFSGMAGLASGDTIADYSYAEGDRIDLRGVDAIKGNATLDHFIPINTAFTGTKGELRIEFGTTGAMVLGDANGDGVADFTLTLLGVAVPEPISFLLV